MSHWRRDKFLGVSLNEPHGGWDAVKVLASDEWLGSRVVASDDEAVLVEHPSGATCALYFTDRTCWCGHGAGKHSSHEGGEAAGRCWEKCSCAEYGKERPAPKATHLHGQGA